MQVAVGLAYITFVLLWLYSELLTYRQRCVITSQELSFLMLLCHMHHIIGIKMPGLVLRLEQIGRRAMSVCICGVARCLKPDLPPEHVEYVIFHT